MGMTNSKWRHQNYKMNEILFFNKWHELYEGTFVAYDRYEFNNDVRGCVGTIFL